MGEKNRKHKPAWQILLESAEAITKSRVGRMDDGLEEELLGDLGKQLEARAMEHVPEGHLEKLITAVLHAYTLLGPIVPREACTFVCAHLDGGLNEMMLRLAMVTGEEHWVAALLDDTETVIGMTKEAYDTVEAEREGGGVMVRRSETTTVRGRDWISIRTKGSTGVVGEMVIIGEANPPQLPAPPEMIELGAGDAAAALGEGAPAGSESADGASAAAPPAEAEAEVGTGDAVALMEALAEQQPPADAVEALAAEAAEGAEGGPADAIAEGEAAGAVADQEFVGEGG